MNDTAKKIILRFFIAILILTLASMIIILLNPLRRNESIIRTRLLKEISLGTSYTQVANQLEKQRLDIKQFKGYGSYRQGKILGSHSIHTILGEYKDEKWFFIFTTSVNAKFIFDENEKLIDILVAKETDAL